MPSTVTLWTGIPPQSDAFPAIRPSGAELFCTSAGKLLIIRSGVSQAIAALSLSLRETGKGEESPGSAGQGAR